MKCPKCHKEVEKGSLYCPYCLAEIPWVKEFDSVETLMKKEQQNRPPQKKSKFKYFNKLKKWKRKKRYIRHISKKQLICLVAFAAILLGHCVIGSYILFRLCIPAQRGSMNSRIMKGH